MTSRNAKLLQLCNVTPPVAISVKRCVQSKNTVHLKQGSEVNVQVSSKPRLVKSKELPTTSFDTLVHNKDILSTPTKFLNTISLTEKSVDNFEANPSRPKLLVIALTSFFAW